MNNNEKILKLLQNDAKLESSEIATMLGCSVDEVKAAIADFKERGIIKGYKTLIDWTKTKTGYASAIIEVKVTPQRDTGFDETAKKIMALPEVESVYLMAGGYDLCVIISAPTMSEVAMFVSRRLSTIEGVLSTATHFVLTKYKDMDTVFSNELEEKDDREGYLCD